MFVLLIASVQLHPQWCNLCTPILQGVMPCRTIHSAKFNKDCHGTDLFSIVVKSGRPNTDLADIRQVKLRCGKASSRIGQLFSMSLPDKYIHTLRIYSTYNEVWIINNLPVWPIQLFHKTYDGELEIGYLLGLERVRLKERETSKEETGSMRAAEI